MHTHRYLLPGVAFLCLPILTGAAGDGCAAASKTDAPDVSGDWAIDYDSSFGVEIKLGGQVYNTTLPVSGGIVTIDHEGAPLEFDLDCARPEVVCPSEAWPETVTINQDNAKYDHQLLVDLPMQSCAGTLTTPAPEDCGANTLNPDCESVCEGEIVVTEQQAFGVIGETGDSFRLYLGGGIATNGVNCALLGWSLADADLVTTGKGGKNWSASSMENGVVTVGYAGGCLWVDQVDPDPALEAAVIGASVTFTVGFTGSRL